MNIDSRMLAKAIAKPIRERIVPMEKRIDDLEKAIRLLTQALETRSGR